MSEFLQTNQFLHISGLLIGAVWIFHGVYIKIFNGIPRHRLIVGKILGTAVAGKATLAIGMLELLVGLWVLSGWEPTACASVQTLAICGMNMLEIALARELLVSALGMVALNLAFLALVWHWALSAPMS
jgi:hypothetical protein